MSFLRRHLGALATTWLLFQVASLSALLPGVCCIAHAEAAQSDPENCHKASSEAEQCPMMSADGQPCPEHAGQTSAAEHCTMRGTCQAPMASLASLFSAPAILADQAAIHLDHESAAIAIERPSALAVSLASDAPPPRL